jgi:hypothetical protein
MIEIGNGIIMIHQCQFHCIGHIIVHHRGLIMICLIFIHHGLQGWSLGMSSPPVYFYPISIPHRGSSASRLSHAHNNQPYSKDRSMGKVKHQVIKQVWCVKKDWNVKKKIRFVTRR